MRETVALRRTSWPLLAIAAAVILAIVGTLALWAAYGTTVFFEIIRVGFTACFG